MMSSSTLCVAGGQGGRAREGWQGRQARQAVRGGRGVRCAVGAVQLLRGWCERRRLDGEAELVAQHDLALALAEQARAAEGQRHAAEAQRHGVEIPHLCYTDGLRPDGKKPSSFVAARSASLKLGLSMSASAFVALAAIEAAFMSLTETDPCATRGMEGVRKRLEELAGRLDRLALE